MLSSSECLSQTDRLDSPRGDSIGGSVMPTLNLRAGEWVEVRSKEEILQTLDKRGQLEGLPFMPQMFQFCGKRLRVYKRAHKTCDTVNGTGGRKMPSAVHLEGLRCDGQAYGGCQAGCLIFWKEAWLKRTSANDDVVAVQANILPAATGSDPSRCTEADVVTGTQRGEPSNDPTYICQATQVPAATSLLPWWDLRQFFTDYRSRNASLSRIIRALTFGAYNALINAGIGLGGLLRWSYDRVQALHGGIPYPGRSGKIAAGANTPTAQLNLQPGELVRVKPYEEILNTVDKTNRNRGLYFDAEMVPYCGGTYRVFKRVTRIINEQTGKMMTFKNPCIILDGVVCQSRYSSKRFLCPRAIYSYWREIWLERVEAPLSTAVREDVT